MKKVAITLVSLWLLLFCAHPVLGLLSSRETEDVPIERLIQNLERRLSQNTNEASTLYYLARLETMAAVTTVTNIEVFTKEGIPDFTYDPGTPRTYELRVDRAREFTKAGHWTNSIRYFERTLALLPKSKTADDRELIFPANLGYGWALDQAGKTNEAIKQYRRTVKMAWEKEVGTRPERLINTIQGTINEKKWADWRLRHVLGEISFSQEGIGYLLKFLDPVLNAPEIADLKRRQLILSKMIRVVSPVIVPITTETALPTLIAPDASVSFDLDGSGLPRRWGWITDRAAWLVWDPRHTGKITSGLQLFGAVTFWIFWRDGYEPMAALDDDGNGVLEGRELEGLALWRDLNSNGLSEPGEVRPLAEWGIVRLQCHPQQNASGLPFHPEGVTFDGGTNRPTYDWSAPLAHEPVR